MFDRERTLLNFSINSISIESYKRAVNNYLSSQARVQQEKNFTRGFDESIDSLLKQAKALQEQCSTFTPTYVKNNYAIVKEVTKACKGWIEDKKRLDAGVKDRLQTVKTYSTRLKEYDSLALIQKEFEKITEKIPFYESGVLYLEKLKRFGNLYDKIHAGKIRNEDLNTAKHLLNEFSSLSKESQFFINLIGDEYKKLKTDYETLTQRIEQIDELTTKLNALNHKADQALSVLIPLDKDVMQQSRQYYTEQIEKISNVLIIYYGLKEKSIGLIDLHFEEKETQLLAAKKSWKHLKELWETTKNESIKRFERKEKSIAFANRICIILFLAITVFIITNSAAAFITGALSSASPGFGKAVSIILGIPFGILSGILNTCMMFVLGGFWANYFFEGFWIPAFVLNILILFPTIIYIINRFILHKDETDTKFNRIITSFVKNIPTLGMIGVIGFFASRFCIVQDPTLFAGILVGVLLGLLFCIVLTVGGGFWLPAVFFESELLRFTINTSLLNTAFWILCVITLCIFLYERKQENPTSNWFGQLIRKLAKSRRKNS